MAEVISAFTEDQTAHLTGLTVHRLRHWDRTGFFSPSILAGDSAAPYKRVYSFRDLLCLQILKALRIDLRCSLQHLREVKTKLSHLGEAVWTRTTLYVLNRKVVFHDEAEGEFREAVSGQIVFPIPLRVVRKSMRAAIDDLARRDDSELGKIAKRRNVSHNAAVFAGTRIPIAAVQRLAEDGFTNEEIIREYPSLTPADIRAALEHKKRAA